MPTKAAALRLRKTPSGLPTTSLISQRNLSPAPLVWRMRDTTGRQHQLENRVIAFVISGSGAADEVEELWRDVLRAHRAVALL